MPTCPQCHAETLSESKYCGQCGHKLVRSFQTSGGKVTQKAMKSVDIRYKLGMIYLKRGKYNEAIETWQKLLEEESENVAVKKLIDEARKNLKIINS